MENLTRETNSREHMVRVSVSDDIDRGELFGSFDKNLKIIENNLKVDIIQRDDSLILISYSRENMSVKRKNC